MATKKRHSVPKIYEIVDTLALFSGPARSKEDKKRLVKQYGEAFEKREEAELYKMGYIKIPRTLLYTKQFKNMNKATKVLLLWLMIKQQIIEIKRKAGIEDEETKCKGVTVSNAEFAFYTGISVKHIPERIKELEEIGWVKSKKRMTGNRVDSTIYQLPTWPKDKLGYIKVPIRLLVTPAWQELSYSAKAMLIVLLSEHTSAVSGSKTPFPQFTIAYEQIKNFGFSQATVRTALQELEVFCFISVVHGKLNEATGKNDLNQYKLSTDCLYLWKEHTDAKRNELDDAKRYKKKSAAPK